MSDLETSYWRTRIISAVVALMFNIAGLYVVLISSKNDRQYSIESDPAVAMKTFAASGFEDGPVGIVKDSAVKATHSVGGLTNISAKRATSEVNLPVQADAKGAKGFANSSRGTNDPFAVAGVVATPGQPRVVSDLAGRQFSGRVGALVLRFQKAHREVHGSATFSVTVYANGSVDDVRYVGGTLAPQAGAELAQMMVEQKLFEAVEGAQPRRSIIGPIIVGSDCDTEQRGMPCRDRSSGW